MIEVQKETECKKTDRCRLAENCPCEYYPQEYYACFDSKRLNYDEYKINSRIHIKNKINTENEENEYENTKYSEKPKNRRFKFCK